MIKLNLTRDAIGIFIMIELNPGQISMVAPDTLYTSEDCHEPTIIVQCI